MADEHGAGIVPWGIVPTSGPDRGAWECCERWFDPPCYDTYLPTNNSDRLLPFGLCSGEWLTSVTTYDYLKVPDVPPGEYVLSFRWDCEASAQVWQSCADITIVA